MSTSTGIEIVIASENRSTLEKQLKSIDDFLLDLSSFIYRNGKKQFGDSKTFQLREQIDRIRKVGDSYIFQIQEQIDYELAGFLFRRFENTIHGFRKTDDSLIEDGCVIEITTEGQEEGSSEHIYCDLKNNILVRDDYCIISILFDPSDTIEDYCHTKLCNIGISKNALRIFSVKRDLYERWYGLQKFTLESSDNFYIGKGYAKTKKYIDLESYYKLLDPQKMESKKKLIAPKGDISRFNDDKNNEVIDEYDKNGLLIHHKDSQEEFWMNEKGELIHSKTQLLEVFYEYDDKGKLLKEYYTEGYEINYEYNRQGLLIEEKDSAGHRAIYSYANGVIVQKTCFNRIGQIVYKTCFDGNDYWYEYDEHGRLLCEISDSYYYNIGYEDAIYNYRYDSIGNVIMKWYGSGDDVCFHFYDSKNRLIYSENKNRSTIKVYDDKACDSYQISSSKNEHERDIFDKDGKLLYSYDETNKEDRWFDIDKTFVHRHISKQESEWLEYDANEKLVRKILFSISDDCLYYKEYDDKGNIVHKIDRYGNQEWYDYDECGRLIRSRDIWGGERILEYDEKGSVVESIKNEYGEFVTREKQND